MKKNNIKILFLHGLDSSKESTNFHAIRSDTKFCIDINYRNLNFDTVEMLYKDLIEKIKPHLVVGHDVGGYWALRLSYQFKLPAIIANPNLAPDFRTDYPPISDTILNQDIPQCAYIELADEILDMPSTQERLERFMLVHTIEAGYHRLQYPEYLNNLIQNFHV